MLYDLFICHASEDKDSFVRPLAEALRSENVEVWYDEFSLKLGDSIRRTLDKGLSQSRFGLVVLSQAFFAKNWPQYELDGLVDKEVSGNDKVILPVWHGVSRDDVAAYSLALADRKAASSALGIAKIVQEILAVVHPQGSPLIAARDALLEWGVRPPVITDEYWLRVVETSNRILPFGGIIPEEASWDRWSFPLPSKGRSAAQWGDRLAWVAMQMNWVETAEKVPITPLTPPKDVLDFIGSHPGLFETCTTYPDLLVEYAPQLTIRGVAGELEEVIEKEYRRSCNRQRKKRAQNSSEGSALTTDGKCPACDEEWALRHPSFGGYSPEEITYAYFHSGMFGPLVSPFEDADHAFWLLSSASAWLPEAVHDVLVEGMRNSTNWRWDKGRKWRTCGALARALYEALDRKGKFAWTDDARDDVLNRMRVATSALNLPETPEDLFERFVRLEFPDYYLKAERDLRERRGVSTSRSRKKKKRK